jgi:hypothetical protein
MIDKKLLAKIRKCLALSASANEHEAAAALAKARALMEEAGLDPAMLDMAEIEECPARGSRNERPSVWESTLCRAVRLALNVHVFLDENRDRRYVGRGARPEIASYAFRVLFRQMKKARADYMSTQLKRCKPHRKRVRADIFCQGWASAVVRKIEQLAPENPADPAVEQYLAVQHPGLVKVNLRSAAVSGRGALNDWLNGNAKGKSVELNQGLHSSSGPLQLT